ncbi:class I SAM-dependent methyltransferase [archaeon]|jgi:ubiquinone/menaquinone biosynthesis C-methylase UbiE|nr:class I SAM-dependent methyltransferase [archaeon]MBT4647070.1 class I SAM-dependent methyltransferase [archaeon]MBT6820979.1 class I SAM-dependent methyltransferase [archaeon]MBT7392698.1 class I SAM-dependent methyltransferase [archaeon]
MTKKANFDKFQKEWNEDNVEAKRFHWLTKDKIINEMEIKIISKLPIKESHKILEVGCGEGQNIYNLKKRHKKAKFYGIDMAKNRIEFAKTKINDAIFSTQDGRKIEYKDNTFDIVFCRDVIHHMSTNRQKFIKEMLRVCKKNGKVILIESNGQNILNNMFSILVKKESELKNISKKYMINLLKKMKLKFSISHVEKHNLQRLIFHYNYGLNFLTKTNFGKLISDIINFMPALRGAKSYAYMIIEIQK